MASAQVKASVAGRDWGRRGILNPAPARDTGCAGKWLQSLAWPVIAAAVFYGLFIAVKLAMHGGDPSAFVVAGGTYADATQLPPGLHVVVPHAAGYDGQWYYRLALDPWTAAVADYGIRFDNPAYRQQRIVYPLLAWALSFGWPALLPAALIAVNLLGLCVIAALGAALARSFGQPSWWGLLPALCPGFAVTLGLDLTEIVEVALLLAGMLLLRNKRYAGAALCLTLAVLARESALLVPAALAMLWAGDRLRRVPHSPPAYLFAAPLATYLGWQGLLWFRWHSLPLRGNNSNIGVPLAGLAGFAGRLAPLARPMDMLWVLEILALGVFGLGVLAALRGDRAPGWLRLSWLLYGLLAACLGASVWVDIGFPRALAEWYVLGTVLLMSARGKNHLLFIAPSLVLWAWMWLAMVLLV